MGFAMHVQQSLVTVAPAANIAAELAFTRVRGEVHCQRAFARERAPARFAAEGPSRRRVFESHVTVQPCTADERLSAHVTLHRPALGMAAKNVAIQLAPTHKRLTTRFTSKPPRVRVHVHSQQLRVAETPAANVTLHPAILRV